MSRDDYELIKNRTFVNPYNFVFTDFKKSPDRRNIENVLGDLSCKISCILTTRSPLIIPDTERKKDNQGHFEYPFYSTRGEGGDYVIPGSALRGTIRSSYEAVTESCLVTAANADSLHARDSFRDAKLPGILVFQNGKIQLYKARRYMLLIKNKKDEKFKRLGQSAYEINYNEGSIKINGKLCKTGAMLSFNPLMEKNGSEKEFLKNGKKTGAKMVKAVNNNGSHLGLLCVGEFFTRKHHASIFVQEDKIESCGDLKKAFDNFIKVVDLYNDEKVNLSIRKEKRRYYAGLKEIAEEVRKNGGKFPVWYRITDGKIVLSPGQISRSVFSTSEKEMVGKKSPCADRWNVCPACALFGMIKASGEDSGSLGSRVRISDAVCVTDVPLLKSITLNELSSPKCSYMPFYTNDGRKKKDTPPTFDDNEISFKGRKYYWHGIPQSRDAERNKRNSSFEVLGEDTRFSFNVFLDRVTEQEIADMLWILTLGEDRSDGDYCYKLGHGKPLGFGSVKITIDDVRIRKYKNGWTESQRNADELIEKSKLFNNTKATEELLTISNINFFAKASVSYPYVTNEKGDRQNIPESNNTAPHQWFGFNREGKTGLQRISDIANKDGTKAAAYKAMHPCRYRKKDKQH